MEPCTVSVFLAWRASWDATGFNIVVVDIISQVCTDGETSIILLDMFVFHSLLSHESVETNSITRRHQHQGNKMSFEVRIEQVKKSTSEMMKEIIGIEEFCNVTLVSDDNEVY